MMKKILIFFVFFAILSCEEYERPFTYHEFDGIITIFTVDNHDTYRKLIPEVFSMPEKPMVMAYVMDFYHMDKLTDPYLEAAVFLLVNYKGRPAWHCITMPVTTHAARLGGIYFLGYPKIMADVLMKRGNGKYSGQLKLKGKTVMTINLDTSQYQITKEDEEMFETIKTIPNLNILNGKVTQPVFGGGPSSYNLLEIAQLAPDKLELKVGKSSLHYDAKSATAYSEKLGSLFSIKPKKYLLSYYLKNKAKANFGGTVNR